MKLCREVYDQIKSACREMSEQANVIPNAPANFLGFITEDVESLDLVLLVDKYARDWWEHEERGVHEVGTCDFTTRRAVIYAIEAVRQMNHGCLGNRHAQKLLRMATKELAAAIERREVAA